MLAPRKLPYATPIEVVHQILSFGYINARDTVYDIGCGDGRFLIAAAKATGAKCIGIEIDESRVQAARETAKKEGVGHLVTIIQKNALECNIADATVVFLALTTRGTRIILPLLQQIKHKARVLSYLFRCDGLETAFECKRTCQRDDKMKSIFPLYVYQLPLMKENILAEGGGNEADHDKEGGPEESTEN